MRVWGFFFLFFIISWSKDESVTQGVQLPACASLFCRGNAELAKIQTIQLTIMRMQKHPGFVFCSAVSAQTCGVLRSQCCNFSTCKSKNCVFKDCRNNYFILEAAFFFSLK